MTNDKKNHCLTDIIMYKQGTLLMTENNKHVQCTRNENLIVVTNKTTLYSTIQTVYNEPYIPVS